MKISQCHHVRIRDNNEYGMDVERFIKSIENQYKINIKTLPQWKQLIQQLHAATTECKRQIQMSKCRKILIIDKIYNENTRPSPFELTDDLVRTAKLWKAKASGGKKPRISIKDVPESILTDEAKYDEISGELSETKYTAHPNTEIVPSEEVIQQKIKSEGDIEVEPSHLPTVVCINQHKLISPLTSKYSFLSYKSANNEIEIIPESEAREWLFLEPTSNIRSNEITVTNPTLDEQIISFSVLNCSTEYMHIRFKSVTDRSPFKKIKIRPVTPIKLIPGLSVKFKLILKLCQPDDFPTSSLYFRVGHNVLLEGPAEALLIPIVSKLKVSRKLFVPKTVTIPPAYSWHVNAKIGFPSKLIQISNGDNCNYHLHIIKRIYDFAKEAADSLVSVDVHGPNTESLIKRVDDDEDEAQNKLLSTSKVDNLAVTEVESLKTIDVIALVVHEIVELALEAFVFEHTYLNLHPHSKRYIPIYFTKVEHTGFHHSYYDFEFCDPETEEIIVTKTSQLYAKVIPHPVKVQPDFLDMSKSPITHGFCEDSFTVINTDRLYSVTVKVKLTTKMKKLFHVSPTEVTIPVLSKVVFQVKLCSKSFSAAKNTDEFAHFTFKIIFSGHGSIYNNVPPFFFEIVAPCATEFKSIYNEKFYSEIPKKSQQTFSKIAVI